MKLTAMWKVTLTEAHDSLTFDTVTVVAPTAIKAVEKAQRLTAIACVATKIELLGVGR